MYPLMHTRGCLRYFYARMQINNKGSMQMLLTETVEMRWNSKNKQRYIDRGYNYTKMKDIFTMRVSDLSEGSMEKIQYKCEDCNKIITTAYSSYLNNREDICNHCSIRASLIGKLKVPYETVKLIFESKGYILVSSEEDYIGSKTKLAYTCSKHGTRYSSYNNMSRGHGCLKCKQETYSGIGHPMFGKTGKLSPLYGRTREKSPSWQGGLTDLSKYLRLQLPPWILQQLQRTNYTCELTGKQGTLNVHHMYSFKNILQDTMKELNIDIRPNIGDYSEDVLQVITINILRRNDLYANPIVMLESVHKAFHKFCGGNKKETSMEQLEQFKATLVA